MKSPLNLSPDHLHLVQAILAIHVPDREVLAFGSRVVGTPKKMSDLDLCIVADEILPSAVLDQLRDAFIHSALPFKVDLVEWRALQPEFRRVVGRDAATVQRSVHALRKD